MARRRWLLLGAAALVTVLVVVTGVLFLGPLGRDTSPWAGRSSGTPQQTAPPPWESTNLPGYEPDPGSFELTPLEDATGDPVTASLSLEPVAVRTGSIVGLSFDATELANPMWDSAESNLTLTLQELDRPVLRFGGNGVDRRMWWTSTDEPAPDWAEATVTPGDLSRVANVADDVDAEVTLVLDLGHDDPVRAADMAAHAQEAFGDRLLAVTIGNEPNGFFHENQPQLAVRSDTWGPEEYQVSLHEYSEALQESAPGVPVAGPGAYDATWWRAFAGSDIPDQRALSMHWYPLWDCSGPDSSIANPTIEDLTAPALRQQARKIVGQGIEVAEEHDLPLWMEETGPTSCPGTNETSLTHAQALWTVDYTLTLAELGVERVAFHSTLQACRGGAPMSPICAQGDLEEPGLIVEGRSSFLALSLLGEVPDGEILPVTVGGNGTTSAHAVLDDDEQLTLVVVDLRDPESSSSAPRAMEISVPEGLGDGAADGWELTEGALLEGDALEATESRFSDLAPVSAGTAQELVTPQTPLEVVSDPGSVTLLRLAPSEPAPSDGG